MNVYINNLKNGVIKVAEWINNIFSSYDKAIFDALFKLAESFGEWLTPLMRFISYTGENGITVLLISIVLVLFRKTRKQGICIFGAVGCGAVITNLLLKNIVERTRPFLEIGSEYAEHWKQFCFPSEEGYSFPSGHVTAAMGGILALVLMSRCKKKISWSFIYVFMIAVSRCYLIAHYPSDVLAALIVGVISALISYFITEMIYRYLNRHRNNAFCRTVLDISVTDLKFKS